MPDLSRIGNRDKLKPKAGDEPHWHRLRQGVYLGYRPSKKTSGGTWFARFYDADTNRNRRIAKVARSAEFDHIPEAEICGVIGRPVRMISPVSS